MVHNGTDNTRLSPRGEPKDHQSNPVLDKRSLSSRGVAQADDRSPRQRWMGLGELRGKKRGIGTLYRIFPLMQLYSTWAACSVMFLGILETWRPVRTDVIIGANRREEAEELNC